MLTGDKIKVGMPQARFVRAISEKVVRFGPDARNPSRSQPKANSRSDAGVVMNSNLLLWYDIPFNAYNPNPLSLRGFPEIQL